MHVDLVKCWTKFDYGEVKLLYILSPTGETSLEWRMKQLLQYFGHIMESILNSTTELKFYTSTIDYSSCLILMSGMLFYFAICID